MKRLAITCPDCYLEKKVSDFLGGEVFLLSILGSAFEQTDCSFLDQVAYVAEQYDLKEIVMVISIDCRFIEATVGKRHRFHTKAERVFDRRLRATEADIALENMEQQNELGKLSVREQFDVLLNRPALMSVIAEKKIRIRGFVYSRLGDSFEEVYYDAY